MKKFPIIAGAVLFALAIPVILVWFNIINVEGDFHITNVAPLKQHSLFRNTSRHVITIMYVVLGAGLYLHYRNNSYALRMLAFFYSVVFIQNIFLSITILNMLLFPPDMDYSGYEKVILELP